MPAAKRGALRIATSAATLVAASLLTTSAAGASTTIGQTGNAFNCSGAYTYVQNATGGPPPYAAPAYGVITSWSTAASGNLGQTMALKVLRREPSDPAKFFTLARDVSRPLVTLALNTFPNGASPAPVRIPIEAGDLLGATGSTNATCAFMGGAGDETRYVATDTAVDPATSVTFPALVPTSRVDIAAVIEPDADRDGFGDETQDLCSINPATQGACPATGKRAAALKKCRRKRGKKRKKCRKKARKLPV